MPESYICLGQNKPAAATLTDIYTVPAVTQTKVSLITVCNLGTTATTFRISVALAGAANSDEQYLYYDFPIEANSVVSLRDKIMMDTTDVMRVYATLATVSFNVFGTEVT